MTSFRIHSLSARPDGSIPFASVCLADELGVQIHLRELDPGLQGVSFYLSLANLYALLEGKAVSLDLPGFECVLTPTDQDLKLDLDIDSAVGHRTFELALGELALAWNLFVSGPFLG